MALFVAEARDGFVENRPDVVPIVSNFGSRFLRFHSLPFAMQPTTIASELFEGGQSRAPTEPADEKGICRERAGLARQISEDHLRHVACGLRTAHLAQRRRINKVRVSAHDFTERRLGFIRGVIAQEFGVTLGVHLSLYLTAAEGKTRHNFCAKKPPEGVRYETGRSSRRPVKQVR